MKNNLQKEPYRFRSKSLSTTVPTHIFALTVIHFVRWIMDRSCECPSPGKRATYCRDDFLTNNTTQLGHLGGGSMKHNIDADFAWNSLLIVFMSARNTRARFVPRRDFMTISVRSHPQFAFGSHLRDGVVVRCANVVHPCATTPAPASSAHGRDPRVTVTVR